MIDKLGPYDLDTIVTGDARKLSKAIPDGSVDFIFTDSVYQNIDDYRWLAETAARVLKPDSACLAWCSNIKQYQCKSEMEEFLDFVLPLQYVVVGKTFRLMYYHTFVWNTPCLWFQKGRALPNRWITDTWISTRPTSRNNPHKWNKNMEAYLGWTDAFTTPNAIIFDPFTGGGTVPAACKILHRHYLAFEIGPAIADMARERVKKTPQPLPLVIPRQEELTL